MNLVDPDNRRPVDYTKRKECLNYIKQKEQKNVSELMAELLESKEDGRIKLFLIYRALQARRNNPDVFQRGAYTPLDVSGKHQESVVAFARSLEKTWVICVAPRFLTRVIKEGDNPLGLEVWDDTRIILPKEAPGEWTDAISGSEVMAEEMDGRVLSVGHVLNHFPGALVFNSEM